MKLNKSNRAKHSSQVSPFSSDKFDVGGEFDDNKVGVSTSASGDIGCGVEDVGHQNLAIQNAAQTQRESQNTAQKTSASNHFANQDVSGNQGKAESESVLEPLTSDSVITAPQDAARARIQAQALAQIQAIAQGYSLDDAASKSQSKPSKLKSSLSEPGSDASSQAEYSKYAHGKSVPRKSEKGGAVRGEAVKRKSAKRWGKQGEFESNQTQPYSKPYSTPYSQPAAQTHSNPYFEKKSKPYALGNSKFESDSGKSESDSGKFAISEAGKSGQIKSGAFQSEPRAKPFKPETAQHEPQVQGGPQFYAPNGGANLEQAPGWGMVSTNSEPKRRGVISIPEPESESEYEILRTQSLSEENSIFEYTEQLEEVPPIYQTDPASNTRQLVGAASPEAQANNALGANHGAKAVTAKRVAAVEDDKAFGAAQAVGTDASKTKPHGINQITQATHVSHQTNASAQAKTNSQAQEQNQVQAQGQMQAQNQGTEEPLNIWDISWNSQDGLLIKGHARSKKTVKAPKKVDESEPFVAKRSSHFKEPNHGWSAMANNKSNFTDEEEEVPVVDVEQLREDVNYVFAQDGLFSQKLKNYSPRQGQVDLADTIAQCMGEEKQILMVEAGTGTGKTFSYLVPPILSNCRVVVSTGTKALQDQLVDKDIPNLLKILDHQDLMFMGLKGHSNYLCRNMFDETKELSFGAYDRMVVEKYVDKCLQKLDDYFNHNLDGEAPNFAELRLKLSAEQRHMISCDSATCQRMRNECPYVRHSPKDKPLEPQDECFITSSRKFAQQCKVITINHALFFASLGINRPNFGDKPESGEMAALEKKVKAGVAQLAAEEQAEQLKRAQNDEQAENAEQAEKADINKLDDRGQDTKVLAAEKQFSHLDDLPDDPAPESTGRVMNMLPKPDVLVFDEAHTLPEVGRSFYTRHYSRKQLLDLHDDLRGSIKELCKFVDAQQIGEALHELQLSIKCLDLTFRTLEPRRYSILEFKYVHADGVDYVKLVKDEADALGIEAAQAESLGSDLASNQAVDTLGNSVGGAASGTANGSGQWQAKDKQQSELIEFKLGASGKLSIKFKQVSSDKTGGSSLKSSQTVIIGARDVQEAALASSVAHCNFDSNWKKDEKPVATSSDSLEQRLDDLEYFGSKSNGGNGYVNYQLLRQQRAQEQGLADGTLNTAAQSTYAVANSSANANTSGNAHGKVNGNMQANANADLNPQANATSAHTANNPVINGNVSTPGSAFAQNSNAFAVPGPLGQYLGMGSEQPQGGVHPQGMQNQGMPVQSMQAQGSPGPGMAQAPGMDKSSNMTQAPSGAPLLQPQMAQSQYAGNAWQAQKTNTQPKYKNQRRRQPYHNPQFNANQGSVSGAVPSAASSAGFNANSYAQGPGSGNFGGNRQAQSYWQDQANFNRQGSGQFGANSGVSGLNAYGGQMPLFNSFGGRLNSMNPAPAQSTVASQAPVQASIPGQANPYMGMGQSGNLNQMGNMSQCGMGQSGMSQAHDGTNTRRPSYCNWQAQGTPYVSGQSPSPFNAQAYAKSQQGQQAPQAQGGYAQGNGQFNQGRAAPMLNSMPGQAYMQPQQPIGNPSQISFGQQSLWAGPQSWQSQAQTQAQAQHSGQGHAQGFSQMPNGAQAAFGQANLWSQPLSPQSPQPQFAQPCMQSQPLPPQAITQPSLWDGASGDDGAHTQGYGGEYQAQRLPAYQQPYAPQGMGQGLNQGSPQSMHSGFNQGAQGQFNGRPGMPKQTWAQGQSVQTVLPMQPMQPIQSMQPSVQSTPQTLGQPNAQPGFLPAQSPHAQTLPEVPGGIANPQVFQAHGQQALLQNSHLPPISNRSEGWSGEDNFVKSQHDGVKASNRTAARGGASAGGTGIFGNAHTTGARRPLSQPGPNSYLNKDRGAVKFNRGQDEEVEYVLDENKNPVFNLNFRNVIIRMVKALQKLLSILNHELDKEDFDKDKLIDAQDVAEQIDDMIAFLTDLMTTDRDKYGNPNCEFVAWVMVRDHNRRVEHVSYDEQGDAQDAKAKEEEELEKSKRYSRQSRGLSSFAQQAEAEVENEYEIFLAPIEIGKFLGPELRRLMSSGMSIVFASATITTNHDFAKFCYDLGLNQSEVEAKIVASPFNYARNARIMYSKDFCSVDDPKRMSKHVAMLKDLIDATPGGVFFLTTSFSALKEAESECRKYFANKRKLYVQGSDSVNNLMAQFRDDGKGILIGTSSFWEGVDVPGQALSLVIIDRLPFKQANDPVNKARLDYCAKKGGNPFFQISVPEAIIKLRQGVGRLIRNEKDLGALIILDPRLETKKYGAEFIDSLPPMTRVRSFDEILEFYDFIREQQRRGLTG